VNIIRGTRQRTEADRADDGDRATLSRRGVLGGLAALPVLYGIGSATPAPAAAAAQPGVRGNAADVGVRRAAERADRTVPTVTGDLVRAAERRYNAPLLTAGTRLMLPAGIKAVPILDYYRHPHIASTPSAWPDVTAADGTTVDASVVPERGSPTRVAILSGFTEGWYELIHAGGRADRVTWDAGKLPFLWLYGEFGGTNEAPYHNRFYTLALQPHSRNPYSHNTLAT